MSRALCALFVAGTLALGLTACAGADVGRDGGDAQPQPTAEPVETTAGSDDASTAAEAGAALCQAGPEADVCVIESREADTDVTLDAYRVVKVIDSSLRGVVTISGAEQVVVQRVTIAGDLMLTQNAGLVLKNSTVTGSVTASGGEHATLVANTVAGDLNCDGARVAGEDNHVSGASACAGLR
ncbi:hypothetical protein IF188_07330 [Microbacterium sp. NEAU-LLC]|uniref:DUF3060 domain-containing protein n=1 Tax=Microbacterium helvum TaxID=2773713 RepID=A0ABR8NMU9_9MICO|nr:hypothetical protein [Microbacterium helvum]MBD3941504.1 hypothetical protein [Microbacterium helvum]